jgi:hypothetical protein
MNNDIFHSLNARKEYLKLCLSNYLAAYVNLAESGGGQEESKIVDKTEQKFNDEMEEFRHFVVDHQDEIRE